MSAPRTSFPHSPLGEGTVAKSIGQHFYLISILFHLALLFDVTNDHMYRSFQLLCREVGKIFLYNEH